MTIPKPSFGNIFLLVVIGVLVVALFKQCPKDKDAAIAKINAAKDSIIIKQDAEMGALIEARKREATKAWEAANETQIAVARYDTAQRTISGLSNQALRLSKELKELRNVLPDSDWVMVSPLYSTYCDSLADEIPVLHTEINTLLRVSQDKDASFTREIKLLIAQKEAEKIRTDTANKRFKELNANYDAYKKKVQPRNSLWIGAEAQLSTVYQTVGGQLQWQTKKGIAYKGGVGLISNGGYYVSGGVAFRISLRK